MHGAVFAPPRRHRVSRAALLVAVAWTSACQSDGAVTDATTGAVDGAIDGAPPADAVSLGPDADPVICAEMSDDCASDFGALFTEANGRADGTLVALLEPTDTQCEGYNDDHAVLQIEMLGEVQRLVVAIDGVAVHATAAPLIGPPFAAGWHTGMTLDYPGDLGVHSPDFTPVTMDQAVSFLCQATRVGDPISVYAYCDGTYPSSAHQIHYNDYYPDGAIVVDPTGPTPIYLLFRYANQVF